MIKNYKCPECNGDGKETCHNPDHGFYDMIGGVVGANESACPCCGHDEDHKVYRWKDGKRTQPDCFTCSGIGIVDADKCLSILEDLDIDLPIEDFELKSVNLTPPATQSKIESAYNKQENGKV